MKSKPYNELIGRNKVPKCYILGAGISLFNDSLHKDFYNIKDAVISVNSSILLGKKIHSQEKYWISNDSAVTYWSYFKDVLEDNSEIIIRNTWEQKYYDRVTRNVWMFSARENVAMALDSHEQRLCGISSVPSAIDLAIQIGYKSIYILGLDHYFYEGKSHFWQMFPKEKQPTTVQYFAPQRMQQIMFEKNMECYEKLNDFSNKNNCKIYNCSLSSKVRAFEKIPFEKTL